MPNQPVAVTIYHNPNCGTSRNTLELIRKAGIEPEVVEYLQKPPDRKTPQELIARMRIKPRELTALAVRLCRSSEKVLDLLPQPQKGS